ncbi:MAG: hypothetical protein LQ349_008072, partial [Xanthoria aureola]
EGRNVAHGRDRVDWLVHGRNRSLPANLVTALINLSDRDLSGYYWIDALCIDQLNHKERNEQVMIMDKIFRRATAVNVWLGKAYSDTQEINRIIEDLVNHQEQEEKWPTRPTWSTGADLMLPSDCETLVQIFSRRWFHRLWTLQEFVLAKEVNLSCGNITIDLAKLLKAARFLSDHQIWMTLSYGNVKRTIHPSILAMSSLQRVVLGDEALEVDFEVCFLYSPGSAQIDYETLLVWVYWRSMAKIATDPRDYVFGIAGVANTLADNLGLQYEPLQVEYSLTTTQVFQAFIKRIMEGTFGIRAIAIVRQTADFYIQHPHSVRTEGLPSWVPDLANRNAFGLSTNGGLRHREAKHNWQDSQDQSSVSKRNGSIKCDNFLLSLIPLLMRLPEAYPRTHHTPIEALLHILRVDVDPSTLRHTGQAFDQAAVERFLVQVLQLFVWSRSLPPSNQNGDQTISWLTHGPGHNPWMIAGLTWDFPTPRTLASRAASHQLGWVLRKGESISEDIEEIVRAGGSSCQAMRRAFGARIEATKLFILQLDDHVHNDSSESSWASQGS